MWLFCFLIHTAGFTKLFFYQIFRMIPVDRVYLEVNLKKQKQQHTAQCILANIFKRRTAGSKYELNLLTANVPII